MSNRLTYQTISELTFFMKVLHFSILNNILQHEINEKPCWTSQILGEKSWKKCDILLFVLMHWSSAPRLRHLKQNSQQKHVTFFSRFFSKDLWSSANFVNEMDNINVIQNWKMKNFHEKSYLKNCLVSYPTEGPVQKY